MLYYQVYKQRLIELKDKAFDSNLDDSDAYNEALLEDYFKRYPESKALLK